MSTIKDDDVQRIAKIAGLKIEKNEIESIKDDLSAIISFFESIDSVDVSNVNGYDDPVLPYERADEVLESVDIKLTLRNSPDKNKNSFIVPRIIKGS